MSEKKNELAEELLTEVAGGADNITPKYKVGDIFGLKLNKYLYHYGVITDITYSIDGPYSYLYTVERKASITGSYGTIDNYDANHVSQIGHFDENAKKFDKLPDPGFYGYEYEYFY